MTIYLAPLCLLLGILFLAGSTKNPGLAKYAGALYWLGLAFTLYAWGTAFGAPLVHIKP